MKNKDNMRKKKSINSEFQIGTHDIKKKKFWRKTCNLFPTTTELRGPFLNKYLNHNIRNADIHFYYRLILFSIKITYHDRIIFHQFEDKFYHNILFKKNTISCEILFHKVFKIRILKYLEYMKIVELK